MIRSRTAMVTRYNANQTVPRSSRVSRPYCSRRHALAKIDAMEAAIGMPQTRKLATPISVQSARSPAELPKASRTRSVSGCSRPN